MSRAPADTSGVGESEAVASPSRFRNPSGVNPDGVFTGYQISANSPTSTLTGMSPSASSASGTVASPKRRGFPRAAGGGAVGQTTKLYATSSAWTQYCDEQHYMLQQARLLQMERKGLAEGSRFGLFGGAAAVSASGTGTTGGPLRGQLVPVQVLMDPVTGALYKNPPDGPLGKPTDQHQLVVQGADEEPPPASSGRAATDHTACTAFAAHQEKIEEQVRSLVCSSVASAAAFAAELSLDGTPPALPPPAPGTTGDNSSTSAPEHVGAAAEPDVELLYVGIWKMNGDPLSVGVPRKLVRSEAGGGGASNNITIEFFRYYVAQALDAPPAVVNVVDGDLDLVLGDDELVFPHHQQEPPHQQREEVGGVGGGAVQQLTSSRYLLAVVRNVAFDGADGLAEALAHRANDPAVVLYQMPDAELNAVDPETGESFLHRYCREERVDVVRALLGREVPRFYNVNLANKLGETALHIACYAGNAELVQLLLLCPFFVNLAQFDHLDNTALHYVLFHDNKALKKLFLPLILPYAPTAPSSRRSGENKLKHPDHLQFHEKSKKIMFPAAKRAKRAGSLLEAHKDPKGVQKVNALDAMLVGHTMTMLGRDHSYAAAPAPGSDLRKAAFSDDSDEEEDEEQHLMLQKFPPVAARNVDELQLMSLRDTHISTEELLLGTRRNYFSKNPSSFPPDVAGVAGPGNVDDREPQSDAECGHGDGQERFLLDADVRERKKTVLEMRETAILAMNAAVRYSSSLLDLFEARKVSGIDEYMLKNLLEAPGAEDEGSA